MTGSQLEVKMIEPAIASTSRDSLVIGIRWLQAGVVIGLLFNIADAVVYLPGLSFYTFWGAGTIEPYILAREISALFVIALFWIALRLCLCTLPDSCASRAKLAVFVSLGMMLVIECFLIINAADPWTGVVLTTHGSLIERITAYSYLVVNAIFLGSFFYVAAVINKHYKGRLICGANFFCLLVITILGLVSWLAYRVHHDLVLFPAFVTGINLAQSRFLSNILMEILVVVSLAQQTWYFIALGRARKHIPKGSQCLACGYDLTGNVSGTCPECGGMASDTPPAEIDPCR